MLINEAIKITERLITTGAMNKDYLDLVLHSLKTVQVRNALIRMNKENDRDDIV